MPCAVAMTRHTREEVRINARDARENHFGSRSFVTFDKALDVRVLRAIEGFVV
jgi:hypothetical protein